MYAECDLQLRLDALKTQTRNYLREKKRLEAELHELQGDTESTDFKLKTTQELRDLVCVFERKINRFQQYP